MTAIPRSVVVLVDPVRASTKLAQLFNGLGLRCVAVLSHESDSEFWRACDERPRSRWSRWPAHP